LEAGRKCRPATDRITSMALKRANFAGLGKDRVGVLRQRTEKSCVWVLDMLWRTKKHT
jgi:hypothetical protein